MQAFLCKRMLLLEMDFVSPIFQFLFFPLFILGYSFSTRRFKLVIGIAGSFVFLFLGKPSVYIVNGRAGSICLWRCLHVKQMAC